MARHDKMVGLVETKLMTADGFQSTACSLGRTHRRKRAGATGREPLPVSINRRP